MRDSHEDLLFGLKDWFVTNAFSSCHCIALCFGAYEDLFICNDLVCALIACHIGGIDGLLWVLARKVVLAIKRDGLNRCRLVTRLEGEAFVEPRSCKLL